MNEKEYLDNFSVLVGFKFYEAYEQNFATVMRFTNERNVEIDVCIVDGEARITEPFAIDNEYLPLEKERIMYKGIEYEKKGVLSNGTVDFDD